MNTRTRALSRMTSARLSVPARLVEAARHAAAVSSFRTGSSETRLFRSSAVMLYPPARPDVRAAGPRQRHGVSTTGNDRPPDLPARARLRELRWNRIGAGLLRHGRERAGRVRADGPGLGSRHQLLRYRRRLRRGPKRDL